MNEQQEIKVLKKLVRAQRKMILNYRTGVPTMPEWVFKAIESAKLMYQVDDISKIK